MGNEAPPYYFKIDGKPMVSFDTTLNRQGVLQMLGLDINDEKISVVVQYPEYQVTMDNRTVISLHNLEFEDIYVLLPEKEEKEETQEEAPKPKPKRGRPKKTTSKRRTKK